MRYICIQTLALLLLFKTKSNKNTIMKTLIRSFFFLSISVVAFTINSSAQAVKPFKGVVTFNITYSGDIDAATMAQQPKLITVNVMNNKQKTNMVLGPVTVDVITDGDKKETITLIDMMGEKKYFKTAQSEFESDLSERGLPDVTYTEETKTIAEYPCKKALYITKDSDGNSDTAVVYYSTDLGGESVNFGTTFHGLKGFPLEYVIAQNGIVTTVTASEIKKGKVKDTDFLIPSDYVEYTADEKAQMKAAMKGGQ
jgi:hypothetical protein